MRKGLLLVPVGVLAAALALAADVTWSYRIDASDKVWVEVANRSASPVAVRLIVLRFFDKGGAPMPQVRQGCETDCVVANGASREFGPIAGPDGWETVEIARVEHEPERGAK